MMHQYTNLSQAEKLAITELLRHETLCAKKCSVYMEQCQDPQIKSALGQMHNIKQQHISTLSSMLQQGGTPGTGMTGTGSTQMI